MLQNISQSSDLSTTLIRFVCNRWMQRAARSRFATSMVQECTTVLDCNSAGARREIDRDAPPQLLIFYKN